MLDLTELDQLKITGTPELVTVDFATMFNESYIDPAEEMKQQPVALSIGTSDYKDNSYPPVCSYGDEPSKTLFKSMIEASYLGGNANQFCPSFKGHETQDKYVISLIRNKVNFIRKECTTSSYGNGKR
jgi:hypothetical protein